MSVPNDTLLYVEQAVLDPGEKILSTATSHKATFAVLGEIRKRCMEKLTRLPLGTILEQRSGALKNTLIERIDSIETTLDYILGLEMGYDTLVGSSGGHLSGGERQRISIARAMMKDAPVIFLNEATANVDPENENELMRPSRR